MWPLAAPGWSAAEPDGLGRLAISSLLAESRPGWMEQTVLHRFRVRDFPIFVRHTHVRVKVSGSRTTGAEPLASSRKAIIRMIR